MKSKDRNKSLHDEDDRYFVGSTQDILNNSEEIKASTPDLEYFSDQCNDGIPEMPCFEVEINPERYAESNSSENKGNS